MATPWSKSKPQIRSIPVRAGSAEIVYASNEEQIADLSAEIDQWENSIEGIPSPLQRDSLDLARYAIRRWLEFHSEEQTAESVRRLKQMIKNNPCAEVRALAVARAGWRRTHKIVGLCTFRRTWCNNINLEVIAAHPVLDEMQNSPIAALGMGFLHHVCSMAEMIDGGAIWGECTQNSADFYSVFVDLPLKVQDLITMPKADYGALKNTIETMWQEAGRQKNGL